MRTVVGVVLIVVFLGFSIALARDIYGQFSKFKDIGRVEGKAQDLLEENAELKKKLETGVQPFTLEKEARDKLGFQQPGETLYVVDLINQKEKASENKKNWEVWVDLFF